MVGTAASDCIEDGQASGRKIESRPEMPDLAVEEQSRFVKVDSTQLQ